MRILVCIFTLLSALITNADIPTPNSVKVFYGGMDVMQISTDKNIVSEWELNMQKCFKFRESSGISLPNDFKHFDYDKNDKHHNDSINIANVYIGKLKKYLYDERVMKVKYEIGKSEWRGAIPEISKNGSRLIPQRTNVYTYVKKVYTLGGKTLEFNDVVITDSKGLISEIRNQAKVKNTDLNSLRNKAAEFYWSKQYQKAYECYEQIVSLYPNDGDSYYRLAIMTFFLEGCEHKFDKKKNARKQGIRYMEIAESKGEPTISEKAGNVLTYWRNPNQ